jgi:hypothetical protein
MPYTLIPAAVKAEASHPSSLPCNYGILRNLVQQLSHDAEVNAAYLKDPLVKQSGSLKGIHDMLTWVRS